MMAMKQMKWGIFYPLFFLAALMLCHGCKKGPKVEELLVGSWRTTIGTLHSVLTFETNGSWVIENKVESEMSQSAAKPSKISGNWFYTDKLEGGFPEEVPESAEEKKADEQPVETQEESKEKLFLVMSVTKSQDDETGWKSGATKPFELVQMDKEKLLLKGVDGRVVEWSRVQADKKAEQDDEGAVKVNLGPLVVNLSRIDAKNKRRYLCLDVELILEAPAVMEKMAKPLEMKLHPRVREAAIFYLSSKTYQDLRTVKKAQEVTIELKRVLNPYFKNRIKRLIVHEIVLTSEKKMVDDYENHLLKPHENGEKKEKAEETETAEGKPHG